MDKTALDIVWLMICAGLVFLMQPGFNCLESGLTRSKNSINVAVKNIADFGLSICLYWAFGFALMFGVSWQGWAGTTGFMVAVRESAPWFAAFFVFQAMFCGTAVTIVSGAVAERMRFACYLLVVALLSGIIYPLFGHWAWLQDPQRGTGWLAATGFLDFAGSTVVHSVGGWVALAVVVILGPRTGRFPADGPPREIPGHNLPLAVLGALLLWLGWLGFNGGSTYEANGRVPGVLMNTLLAGSAGLVTALAAGGVLWRRADVMLLINGSLAGLVSITAGCDVVSSSSAVLIGAIGSLVMLAVERLLERLRIDDVVGAIPVHAGAGVWGTLSVALFGSADAMRSSSRVDQFIAQTIGVTTCFAWSFGTVWVVLYFVNRWWPLRVSAEAEQIGLNVSEHGARTDMLDVLEAMDRQEQSGDMSLTVPVEPFTEVGRIADRYNRVISSLRRAVARTDAIVRSASDAIVTFTRDSTTITYANPGALRVFGFQERELVGRPVGLLLAEPTGGSMPLTEADLSERLQPDGAHELRGRRADGAVFDMDVTVTESDLGDGPFCTAIIRDISVRKQQEAALREARDAAEAASRAKSEFLANMSHEIRTPMNAVIGLTELLLDSPLNQTQREYVAIVRESGEGLLAVINDILDFSRIEAGKLRLDPSPFRLRDSLGDTMKSLAVRAHARSLELVVSVDSEVPDEIIGDFGRLRQILMNLVGNAIKFTPEGEVVVRVDLESVTDQSAVVHFAISDTGIGIDPDKQDSIFRAFEQADTSTTRQYGGTGLGLAICSRLVELMQGRIWVNSQKGRGSVFHFTAKVDVAPDRLEKTVPVDLTGVSVLVVDDNATNRLILCHMLSEWGMEPAAASSAAEGLQFLEQAQASERTIPLVITDVHMPGVDGFEFSRRLRAGAFKGTVIMMLTSGEHVDDLSRARELGVASCMIKPVKESELRRAVSTALGEKTTSVPQDSPAPREAPPRPLRILLAEDSVPNQKLALGILQRHGHQVTIAGDGEAAVAAVQADEFDLVLMDIQMPRMDGLDATAAIRRHERGTERHVPIIAMTAHALPGDRERCFEAGMDAYLSKPIRSRELLNAVQALVGAPVRDRAAESASEATGESGVLDWNEALRSVEGDQELLRTVVEAVLAECPTLLAEIDEGLRSDAGAEAAAAAHKLAGSVRFFGETQAADLARRMEATCRQGDLQAAAELLPPLQHQFKFVVAEFDQFLNQPDAD